MKAIYRRTHASHADRDDLCYCLRSKVYSRARINRLLDKLL